MLNAQSLALGALLALSVIPTADAAPPSDPVLEADEVEIDLSAGAYTYRGAVVYRQEDIRLDCDHLITHFAGDGTLNDGVCTGTPAIFLRPAGEARSEVRAQAARITLESAGAILLLDDAKLEFDGRLLRGQRIHYDPNSGKITAGSAEGTDQRVYITIPPR